MRDRRDAEGARHLECLTKTLIMTVKIIMLKVTVPSGGIRFRHDR